MIGINDLREPLGDTIHCPLCGGAHEVVYGEKVLLDGTREQSKLLAFYECGKHSYLCGIGV